MKKKVRYISTGLLIFLGLISIFMGGSVILDLFGIRAIEGNYVLFVVWANFLCGFLYLVAAWGFLKQKSWVVKPLGLALVLLLITFTGLLIHIYTGGIYEKKTVGAMSFRTIITLLLMLAAKYSVHRK